MNFVDVICICQEVPTVRSCTLRECAEEKPSPAELHATFLDQDTGERPAPPVGAKCQVHRPKRKGLFVAHIAVDETCGITQVGTVQWQPLAPVFRAYLASAQGQQK
jgi:hypothetical protein